MASVVYTVEQALGVVHRLVWAYKLALEPLLACRQAWLEGVADKLEPEVHKPVPKLEVVGKYELEDDQRKLYAEPVVAPDRMAVVDCRLELWLGEVHCRSAWVEVEAYSLALVCRQALVEHKRASVLVEAYMLAWLVVVVYMLALLALEDCRLVWVLEPCKLEQLCLEQHILGLVEQWRLEQGLEEH